MLVSESISIDRADFQELEEPIEVSEKLIDPDYYGKVNSLNQTFFHSYGIASRA
jgi:hypothetical protein